MYVCTHAHTYIQYLHTYIATYHMGGSTVLWLEHWPGDRKVAGSMPSCVSYCCCCFLEQGTLLSLLQFTQLYKYEPGKNVCTNVFVTFNEFLKSL